jgi:Skp family chaperone for outer membrane proteins
MVKKVLLILIITISIQAFAQKPQRIGFIDMEYILENIPEYTDAQAKINAKAITWQNKIEKLQKEVEDLKADLYNEKELLTKELIADKEEDIEIKELDIKKLQVAYFGTNGDLYFLRQQLVKPIQDLVYNAIQDIAIKRRYDFILDNSSDLIMLYTNKKYNISDLVIKSITRSKKIMEATNKSIKKGEKVAIPKAEINEKAQQKIDIKAQRKAELQKRIEEKRAAQLKKREALKKAIEAKRQARIKQIEDANKAKDQTKENN